MSNKLKKVSHGFGEVKNSIKQKLEGEGGVNVTPDWVKEFTECEDKDKVITEDEFYTILAELVDKDGYRMYKIIQVSKDGETRGMMLCAPNTSLVFYKDSEKVSEVKDEEKDEEKK